MIALYLYSGPFTAVAQNVDSPGLRASALTALLFISHVFGDSHSTFDVGWLSDRFAGNLEAALLRHFAHAARPRGDHSRDGLRTVKHDTERMEEAWAAHTAPLEATVSGS